MFLPLSGHDRQLGCRLLRFRHPRVHLGIPVDGANIPPDLMIFQMACEAQQFTAWGPEGCEESAIFRQLGGIYLLHQPRKSYLHLSALANIDDVNFCMLLSPRSLAAPLSPVRRHTLIALSKVSCVSNHLLRGLSLSSPSSSTPTTTSSFKSPNALSLNCCLGADTKFVDGKCKCVLFRT